MSAYDYHRLTTPHIDRLADEGVLFEKMFSPNIPTPPGYIPMLTGRDLFSTQVVSLHHKDPLDPAIPTLPEILRISGINPPASVSDLVFIAGSTNTRNTEHG